MHWELGNSTIYYTLKVEYEFPEHEVPEEFEFVSCSKPTFQDFYTMHGRVDKNSIPWGPGMAGHLSCQVVIELLEPVLNNWCVAHSLRHTVRQKCDAFLT